MKAIEEHGKQLVQSNALIKAFDQDTEKDFKNKKTYLINLLMKSVMKYQNQTKKINHDNLRYLYKGKNIGEKSFNNFDNAFSFINKRQKYNAKAIKMSINQI